MPRLLRFIAQCLVCPYGMPPRSIKVSFPGRWRAGQDPSVVEALLHRHAGAHFRDRLRRQRKVFFAIHF